MKIMLSKDKSWQLCVICSKPVCDEHEHILEVAKLLNEAPVPTENRYWVDENGEIQSNITQQL